MLLSWVCVGVGCVYFFQHFLNVYFFFVFMGKCLDIFVYLVGKTKLDIFLGIGLSFKLKEAMHDFVIAHRIFEWLYAMNFLGRKKRIYQHDYLLLCPETCFLISKSQFYIIIHFFTGFIVLELCLMICVSCLDEVPAS